MLPRTRRSAIRVVGREPSTFNIQLGGWVAISTSSITPTAATVVGPLESAEATAIREALARRNGNGTRTARDLGICRNTLWRKMKKHRIR
jgi:transcriptional regulator of acetoin/glycerol metabolism